MTSPIFHNSLRLTAFLLVCFLGLSCLNDSNHDSRSVSAPSTEDGSLVTDASPNTALFLATDSHNTEPTNFYEAWMAIPPVFLQHPHLDQPLSTDGRKRLWQKGRAAKIALKEIDSLNGYLRYGMSVGEAEVETVVCYHKVHDLALATDENPFPIATRRILISHNFIGAFTATLGVHVLEPSGNRWVDQKGRVLPEASAHDFDIPENDRQSAALSNYISQHAPPGTPSIPVPDFLRWQLPRNGRNILVAPGKIHLKKGLPQELRPFHQTTDKRILYETAGLYSPKSSNLGPALLQMPLEFLSTRVDGQPTTLLAGDMDSEAARAQRVIRNDELHGQVELIGSSADGHSLHLHLGRYALSPYDLIVVTGNAGPGQPQTIRCIAKRGRLFADETAERFPKINLQSVEKLLQDKEMDTDKADWAHLRLLPIPDLDALLLTTRPDSGKATVLATYMWDGSRFQLEPKAAPEG